MFRGFRWQFILFVVAFLLFAAAALFRLSRQSAPRATTGSDARRHPCADAN